ncbi:hypothetical protein ACO0OL_003444 [Hanseniaspora opuntiae]|jgi:small nuclear ribonucleoprotein (snRNP)-like protein|uniref:Sm domain-containing protein n=1 Tax=Hanseniaspora opuntiae TaxID=211096 RepID=A0A1E5RM51_9ASCO|nr:hypothetical protein AWRI3578_g2230 [Hanseniaspora opuntiae]
MNNNKFNKYQKNNKFNKYQKNNKYNKYNNTQSQPIKISNSNCIEFNNYLNDIVEIYLVKNMKIHGKLVSYDLDNMDCVLEDSTLFILKDLQTLTDEEEIAIENIRSTMQNPYDDIVEDKIDYGLAMVKGINIVSFSKL